MNKHNCKKTSHCCGPFPLFVHPKFLDFKSVEANLSHEGNSLSVICFVGDFSTSHSHRALMYFIETQARSCHPFLFTGPITRAYIIKSFVTYHIYFHSDIFSIRIVYIRNLGSMLNNLHWWVKINLQKLKIHWHPLEFWDCSYIADR
jgi:hypothetical protein